MITQEEIYWIMQADHIRALLRACLILFVLLSLASIVCTSVLWAKCADAKARKGLYVSSILIIVLFILVAGHAFYPSTKTLICMKVIPAVVNNSFVQDELPKDMRDIYEGVKKNLKELGKVNEGK